MFVVFFVFFVFFQLRSQSRAPLQYSINQPTNQSILPHLSN